MNNILLAALIVLSIPFIILAVRVTVVRMKALDERIDQYHAEQEAARQQPGPINPYQDMSQAFGVDSTPEEKKQDQAE